MELPLRDSENGNIADHQRRKKKFASIGKEKG